MPYLMYFGVCSQGGVLVAIEPDITYVSRGYGFISFTVKNNNDYELDVYYEYGDSTPEDVTKKVTLGGGATSGTIALYGLPPYTYCTIYARAFDGVNWSTSDSIYYRTLQPPDQTETPTISNVLLGGIKTDYTTWRVYNNDEQTSEILSDTETTPVTDLGDALPNGYKSGSIYDPSGLIEDLYATAQDVGRIKSDVEHYIV